MDEDLRNEAAAALLRAVKATAPSADAAALRNLAEVYAIVTAPRRTGPPIQPDR